MRRSRNLRGLALAVWVCVGLASGCTALQKQPGEDSIEAVLPASPARVKAALLDVLANDGYTPATSEAEASLVETGYRQEIASPWNVLLVARLGVGRSWVECTIAPAEEGGTRLHIHVRYEAKDRLWGFWEPAQPPLAQSAANQLRLIKNALGLL
ncbi:hypothetical protein [Nitrospira sp. Kam-Ns4a]